MTKFLTKIKVLEDQTQFDYIKEIDQVTFDRVKLSTKIIDEFHETSDLLKIVSNNYQEIRIIQESSFKALVENLKDPLNLDKDDYARLKIEINRTVLNYLSSVRTFLDHCELKIKRRFGKNSDQFLRFRSLLTSTYDSNFEYRFIYKLRNFCQHCGLPVCSFSIENDFDKISLSIYFNSARLINEYDSWGNQIKNDLKSINGEFLVNNVLHRHLEIILDVAKKIDFLYQDIFETAIVYLNDFTKYYRDTDDLLICEEINESEEKKTVQMHRFPFDIIDLYSNINN